MDRLEELHGWKQDWYAGWERNWDNINRRAFFFLEIIQLVHHLVNPLPKYHQTLVYLQILLRLPMTLLVRLLLQQQYLDCHYHSFCMEIIKLVHQLPKQLTKFHYTLVYAQILLRLSMTFLVCLLLQHRSLVLLLPFFLEIIQLVHHALNPLPKYITPWCTRKFLDTVTQMGCLLLCPSLELKKKWEACSPNFPSSYWVQHCQLRYKRRRC